MLGLFKRKKNEVPETDEFKLVCEAIANIMGDENLAGGYQRTDSLEALGFDSIKYMNLLLAMEDLVQMDLEEIVSKVDLATLNTIGDIADFAKKLKS